MRVAYRWALARSVLRLEVADALVTFLAAYMLVHYGLFPSGFWQVNQVRGDVSGRPPEVQAACCTVSPQIRSAFVKLLRLAEVGMVVRVCW